MFWEFACLCAYFSLFHVSWETWEVGRKGRNGAGPGAEEDPGRSVTVASPKPEQMFVVLTWCVEPRAGSRISPERPCGLRLSHVRSNARVGSRAKVLPCDAFDQGSRIAPEV
jgi:hypothetical protein